MVPVYLTLLQSGLVVFSEQSESVMLLDPSRGTIELTRHPHDVLALATLDNHHFASGSFDGTIKLYQMNANSPSVCTQIRTWKQGRTIVLSLAKLSDGRLVSGAGDTIKIWDIAHWEIDSPEPANESYVIQTGILIRTIVAMSHNRLALGLENGTIKIWDAITKQIEKTFSAQGHTDPVYALSESSDGRRLLSGSFDKTIKIWDIETGQLERTMRGHATSINSIIEAQPNLFLSGTNDGLYLCDIGNNTHTEVKKIIDGGINSLLVSDGGRGKEFILGTTRNKIFTCSLPHILQQHINTLATHTIRYENTVSQSSSVMNNESLPPSNISRNKI